jgi:hypothetical protein
MALPLTIHGELLVPIPLPYGFVYTELETHLRQAGMLPATAHQCRWRLDAERMSYVVSYEVVVTIETGPVPQWDEKG